MSARDRAFLGGFAASARVIHGWIASNQPKHPLAQCRLWAEHAVRQSIVDWSDGSLRNADRHERGLVAGFRAAVGCGG